MLMDWNINRISFSSRELGGGKIKEHDVYNAWPPSSSRTQFACQLPHRLFVASTNTYFYANCFLTPISPPPRSPFRSLHSGIGQGKRIEAWKILNSTHFENSRLQTWITCEIKDSLLFGTCDVYLGGGLISRKSEDGGKFGFLARKIRLESCN